MKEKIVSRLKWLIPAVFVLLGWLLNTAVRAHGFLGLICYGIAGVVTAYFLLELLQKKNEKAAKVGTILLTCALCVGVLVFGITEAFVIHASRGNEEEKCDYIIVLGCQVNGTTPSLSLKDRIDTAYRYLQENPHAKAVLSGGQGENEDIPEAECMFRELTDRGIAPERLLLEEASTSTWENLKFSLALIQAETGEKPETVGVLSGDYHLLRAGLFAKQFGVEAVGIPAKTSMPTIRINYFLREAAGIWHYILLGGQYHD